MRAGEPWHRFRRKASYHRVVPASFAFIFRAVVTLLLALHVLYMYCTARGMHETFGFDLGVSVVSCLFSLAMLIPLVWAVALPEIPEALSQHVIPRRRWRRGHCPSCDYDMQGRFSNEGGEALICPECGRPAVEPAAWQVGRRTVALFVSINLLAWIVGCVVGETWMLLDERDFSHAVEQRLAAGNTAMWSRARLWPNGSCSLVYSASEGVRATE